MGHTCKNGEWSDEPAYWVRDAQGIDLCKTCDRCHAEKMARYRPEILSGYAQSDVDEPIEPDDWGDRYEADDY